MDNENEPRNNDQEGRRYGAVSNKEGFVKIDTHISLFQILIIVLLIIIIGFLVYLNKKSGENIGKNTFQYSSYRDFEDEYDDDHDYIDYNDDDDYDYDDYEEDDEYGDYYHDKEEEVQFNKKAYGDNVFNVSEEERLNYIDPEDFKKNIEPNIVLNEVYSSTDTFSYSISNNNVGKDLKSARLLVAFYDEANKLIGIDEAYLACVLAQSTAYFCGEYANVVPYARYDYRVVLDEDRYNFEIDKDAIIYTLAEGRDNYFINVESTQRNNGVTSIFFAKYKDAAGNVIFVDNLDSYVSSYGDYDLGRETLYVEKELYDKDDKPVKYSTCEIEYYTSYLDKSSY